MRKIRVLFVCSGNTSRSQMAEAWLKELGGDRFMAESAGLEPGVLNPYTVRAMQEVGIDISGNKTKSVFQFHHEGRSYDYVITVCDQAKAEKCPHFIGERQRIAWAFKNPAAFTGTGEEILQQMRDLRDDIRRSVEDWLVNIDN